MPLDSLDNDRLLSISEVARLLSVSPYTVRRWVHCGRVEAVKLGRGKRVYYRVPTSAVRALLEPTDTAAALPNDEDPS